LIGTALSFVRKQLNAAFAELGRDTSEVVVLAGLAGQPATAEAVNNRLILSLTNIRQETVLRNLPPPPFAPRTDGSRPPPPVFIIIDVVFAANYADYPTGLDVLADAISFLQAKPVFDHDNSPDLDPRLDRLVFALLHLDYAQLSHLWGLMGTEFRPAVFYEVRMLPMKDPRTADPRTADPRMADPRTTTA
jgi:hypothetical protein